MLFESKSFRDAPIRVVDRTAGPIETNLICWAVRDRNCDLLVKLLNFGADVNAAEGPQGSGPFPLMISVRNLAAPPWSGLAMGVLQLGKDTPCIELSAVVAIVRRSKWEVCHIADTLQDSKGNPLKSPTGRQLFSRTSWKFSWYGFQAVCAEVSAELKANVDAYTHNMDVGVSIYELLLGHAQVSVGVGGGLAGDYAV